MGIPPPEPGLVINYAYLWHHEHLAGIEDGRKDRPSVIVLCVTPVEGSVPIVTILPITHSAPADASFAIEIPAAIKRHLGLDEARFWIVIAEGNEFAWPGYDIRKTPGSDDYVYGFLPPRFFKEVRDAFVACHRAGRALMAPRT
jgi:hypothetical protein